jgi:hypothetical protein
MTLNLNDEYEKNLVELALRQLAETCFRNAVTAIKNNDFDESATMKERGEKSSKLADRISYLNK